MEETVLIYIEKDNKYLMIFRNKKKNDLNQGKYLGIGGHIEENETKDQAVVREVFEETSLTLNSFEYRAKLLFTNNDSYSEIMHLYTSSDFSGEVNFNCNEGELVWVEKKSLSSLPMWEGDKYFLSALEANDTYFEMTLKYQNDVLVEIDNKID